MALRARLPVSFAMTYNIQGAQGFRISALSAVEALTKANAAHRQFPPIKIVGPLGELSLAELTALVAGEQGTGDAAQEAIATRDPAT